MKRRPRLVTNFAINLTGMLLPFLISLVAVPIYLSHIGAARYGILFIVWILLGYFGFLDFGLSRASANALAKLGQQPKERSRVLATAFYLNLILGCAGGLLLYFVGSPLLRYMLALPEGLAAEVDAAVPWISGMLLLAVLAGVARGALESQERFLSVNFFELTSVVLTQLIPLVCAVAIGPSLAIIIPAAFVARAISLALTLGFIAKTEESIHRRLEFAKFRELFGFGAWVSVSNVISPVLTSLDQLLIGATLGPAAVAHYSVPMNIAQRSQTIATSLARSLFPRFSRLSSAEANDLARRSIVPLGYLLGAACAPTIIFGRPFLTWWLGPDFASQAIPVFELLMVGAWVNGIAFVPLSLLQGQGRPDLSAKLHASELLPYILTLWIMLQHFGLIGAAAAWLSRVTIDGVLLVILSRLGWRSFLRLIPIPVLLIASYCFAQTVQIPALYSVIASGTIFLIVIALAFSMDSISRNLFLEFLRRPISAAK